MRRPEGTKCVSAEIRRASTGTATRARYLEPRGIRRSEISRQVLKPTDPDSGAIVKRPAWTRSGARRGAVRHGKRSEETMKGAVTMKRERCSYQNALERP